VILATWWKYITICAEIKKILIGYSKKMSISHTLYIEMFKQ
jgi:hypothetical protein